jgi:hypothetical protein
MHKHSTPWEGPFIITEVISPSTYRLQWGDGQGVPNPWNVEHLLSYGPPWAHYLGAYQNRLLGGPLGLPDLCRTVPVGVRHKD